MIVTTPTMEIGQNFLSALSERDFYRLQDLFREDAQFRALVPTGTRVGNGAAEAVNWLRRWFGTADEVQMLSSSVDQVSDRLHIAYSFRARIRWDWQVIEHQVFCTVSNGQIDEMNLVSSDFLPEPEPQTEVMVGTYFDRGL